MTSDQSYYWTPAWQAAEREADDDIAAGRVRDFDNVEDLITSLHESRAKKGQDASQDDSF